MKEELLLELSLILQGIGSIKNHVDEVYELRKKLDEFLDDDERYHLTSRIKSRVQSEALLAWVNAGRRGAIILATGAGKSKIGISAIADLFNKEPEAKSIISVPTEKLRDENWPDEFRKWNVEIPSNLKLTCYASLSSLEGNVIKLAILDEGHNITENNAVFFEKNSIEQVLWLSATKPRDRIKIELLKNLGINPVYELTLDDSVKLGLVAPYDITIVTSKLDKIDKYVTGGSKKNPFKTTEFAQYKYLSKVCIAAPAKFAFIQRMQFIYNLKSKTEAAIWVRDNLLPKDKRVLFFCGSIEQAEALCTHTFHSKTNDAHFNKFKAQEIDWMSCVNAINEGHNLNDVDIAHVIQLNSNDLHLIQRMGRILRFAPGHIGHIIIHVADNTVDMNWVIKATEKLDSARITFVEFEKLKQGLETISFD